MSLSDSCVERLDCYGDDLEQDEIDSFIANAEACVFMVKYMSETPRYLSKPANKRIKNVLKAFEGLTEEDRRFLDLHIELVREMKFGTSNACVDMDYALKQKVAPANSSLSRQRLIDFAEMALKRNWIDVTEHNGNLVQVLKILMKESGVKHDANAIAKTAADSL